MDAPTSDGVRAKFSYIFETPPGSSYPPILTREAARRGRRDGDRRTGRGPSKRCRSISITATSRARLSHRRSRLYARPRRRARASLPFLAGLKIWIIDALRYHRHPSHLSFDQALGWIARMKPERAILTNLHTDLDYETLRQRVPETVAPAYDGMRVEGFSTKSEVSPATNRASRKATEFP